RGEAGAVALDNLRRAVRLRHDDPRGVIVGNVRRYRHHVDVAVTGDRAQDGLGDDAAVPEEGIADHAVGGRLPSDTEQVGSQAAGDSGGPVGVRTEDEEAIVARAPVDLHRFDVHEVDVQPRPENTVRRDNEVVVELGADDDHRVEAV